MIIFIIISSGEEDMLIETSSEKENTVTTNSQQIGRINIMHGVKPASVAKHVAHMLGVVGKVKGLILSAQTAS